MSLSLLARARVAEPIACPNLAAGESAEDCPWAGASRFLSAEAEAGEDRARAHFDVIAIARGELGVVQ